MSLRRTADGRPHSRPTYLVAHPGAELFGSDRMALESVRGFVSAGARVVVALPEQGPLVDELRQAGAAVVIIPMLVLRKSLMHPRSWGRLVRDSLRGLGAAWRLLSSQHPDALYVSTITIPQWPVIGRLRRVPVVSHVHEAEGSAARLVSIVLNAPQLFATRLLVNSEFSLRTMSAAIPALSRRALVVYNGVAGPADAVPPRAEIDELRVLYVGRLSPRKGVDDVLRAGALLAERRVPVRISLLGSVFPGYEWYEDELRSLAASTGISVAFLGFQPDIWPVLADHDVLVVPSVLDEPFGNTAVEGILAHRPVVATDTSGLREAAGGYPTTILVHPSDPVALADALQGVVEHWSTLRGQVAQSAAMAEKRHSPAAYGERVSAAVAEAARIRRLTAAPARVA